MSKAHTIQAQKPVTGEPTAVGYPCILKKRDIDVAQKQQVGQGSAGATLGQDPMTEMLQGSGLSFNSSNHLYYWYSNANSSSYCDTGYTWHSGYVIAYQAVGVCTTTGLEAYNIWVSDLP